MSSDEKAGCFTLWMILCSISVGIFYMVTDSAIGAAKKVNFRDYAGFIINNSEYISDEGGKKLNGIIDTMIADCRRKFNIDLNDSIYDVLSENKNIHDIKVDYIDSGDPLVNRYIRNFSDTTVIQITAKHKEKGEIKMLFGGINRSFFKAKGGQAFLIAISDGVSRRPTMSDKDDIFQTLEIIIPIYAGE